LLKLENNLFTSCISLSGAGLPDLVADLMARLLDG